MNVQELEARIAALVADRSAVRGAAGRAIDEVIAALDDGTLRVAEYDGANWITHAWIKQAILLYFARMDNVVIGDAAGRNGNVDRTLAPSYYDKVPTKRNYEQLGVRCVPPGVARYGSFLGRGTVLMPGFVNIGAYVDEGSMVDTWATVGSCAQIGKNVHLSGGVGIGGVLEPPQATPVIVEDGAFVGSRCIIVEGVRIGREAVLAPNVTLTASVPIIDVTGPETVEYRGEVPPRSIVVPGTRPKEFPAGTYHLACALIIGQRSESTDLKTSLNDALREYGIGT